jgi:hypothetical protein
MNGTKDLKLVYKLEDDLSGIPDSFFDNLPEVISLPKAESLLNKKIRTFYDWRYRPVRNRRYPVPRDLFMKICGELYIRRDVLKRWIALQNSA